MADLFGCDSVSHRANADVDALCGVWRVLLVALTDLPQGLMARLADMHPGVPWSYRPIFSFLAGQNPGSIFSLSAARADVLKADRADDRVDADELPVLKMPSREEIEADYAPGGLVNRMYPTYEPRDEQIAMALEVRDALVTGTHRVIEAGTGVGKSMAYLVPLPRQHAATTSRLVSRLNRIISPTSSCIMSCPNCRAAGRRPIVLRPQGL